MTALPAFHRRANLFKFKHETNPQKNYIFQPCGQTAIGHRQTLGPAEVASHRPDQCHGWGTSYNFQVCLQPNNTIGVDTPELQKNVIVGGLATSSSPGAMKLVAIHAHGTHRGQTSQFEGLEKVWRSSNFILHAHWRPIFGAGPWWKSGPKQKGELRSKG